MKLFLCTLLCLGYGSFASAQGVRFGTLVRLPAFDSTYVATRPVDVWLPPGYTPKQKYVVLYMHDGQMLFDSTTTWNKQEWQVDEVLGKLINEKRIKPIIVVAVYNNGKFRHSEYMPQKPIESLPDSLRSDIVKHELQGKAQADNYLKFLVHQVKPYVDAHFATRKDAKHTFIMGSSMGGLISMYGMMEYPKFFGGAGCLSTHWIGSVRKYIPQLPASLIGYVQQHKSVLKTHLMYNDHGTVGLDSLYAPFQKQVDAILKPYQARFNYQTLVFDKTSHNEKSWAGRLDIPIRWLVDAEYRKASSSQDSH